MIKLCNLQDNLHLASNMNLLLLCMELDFIAIINLLNSNMSSHSLHVEVLAVDCSRFLQLLGHSNIAHIYREMK